MKIILISTYYKYGGAEVAAILEKEILKDHKNDVLMITFDPKYKSGEWIDENTFNLRGNYTKYEKRIKDIILDNKILCDLNRIYEDFYPDFVHLHNITYAANTIYKSLEGIAAVQTIHDFTWLCAKEGRCLTNDLKLCNDYHYKHCFNECYTSIKQRAKLIYRIIIREKTKKYRIRNVNRFICPSKKLTKYVIDFGYNAVTINNPISNSSSGSNYKNANQYEERSILCYGRVDAEKGIWQLIDAYNGTEYKNIKLYIAGNFSDDFNQKVFFKKCKEKKIKYIGHIDRKNINKILSNTFSIIIPSLYMENYPTTALEGFENKCLVCGSNRGGIPELITDQRLLFDILNPNSIRQCLHFIDEIDDDERKIIVKRQTERLKNNSSTNYFNNLMKLINGIKNHG